MKITYVQDPKPRIENHPNPDRCWLWCELCHRFFRYKSAEGPRDACPFDDCQGVGIGFNLLMWDDLREPKDPRWPSCEDQLAHGMRSPEMAPFYAAQLDARIDDMVAQFTGSPECAAALAGEPPRHLRPFLQMMSDLCWDLTEASEASFSDLTARELITELPVWSETSDAIEAQRMAVELRAFFAFAERTTCVQDAEQWRALVADHDLPGVFRYTMKHDKRLRLRLMRTRPRLRRTRPRTTQATKPDPRDGMRRGNKRRRRGRK